MGSYCALVIDETAIGENFGDMDKRHYVTQSFGWSFQSPTVPEGQQLHLTSLSPQVKHK
jgi:hypothetical protein